MGVRREVGEVKLGFGFGVCTEGVSGGASEIGGRGGQVNGYRKCDGVGREGRVIWAGGAGLVRALARGGR